MSSSTTPSSNRRIAVRPVEAGVLYSAPPGATADWLGMPLANALDDMVRGFLAQLEEAGLVQPRPDHAFLLPWAHVHHVIEEHRPRGFELPLPPVDERRVPGVMCTGDMSGGDFAIRIDGWYQRDDDGAHRLPGPFAFFGPTTVPEIEPAMAFTMARTVYALVQAVERFAALEPSARNAHVNRERFAEIRTLALACGAVLDAQFRTTFVLAPNDVWLTFDPPGVHAGPIAVTPTFEHAPRAWRDAFRRRVTVPYSGVYPFTGDDGEHVEVVLREPVRRVLQTLRTRFPSGTATGPAARQLLSNPVALFGDDARVLDTDRTEDELRALRRTLWTFTPQVDAPDGQTIERVGVVLTPVEADDDQSPRLVWLATPERVRRLADEVADALARGEAVIDVLRHPVELSDRDGDVARQLAELADAWKRRARVGARRLDPVHQPVEGDADAFLIDAAWVFDLSKYADRIEAIGVDLPFAIAEIPLTKKAGWLPDSDEWEVLVSFKTEDGEGTPERWSREDVEALERACEEAERRGDDEVILPDGRPLHRADAAALVRSIQLDGWPTAPGSREDDAGGAGGAPPRGSATTAAAGPSPRIGLRYKANIEQRDYVPGRAEDLDHRPAGEPQLPTSLRADVTLRDHQRRGVAWLQALLARSPRHCRGALLADDMGLGKTLQLLTVIAKAHEDDPSRPPSLVVAPVSLIDNWEQEVARFFAPGALPRQRVAGAALAALKAAPHEIAPDVRARGVTRVLRPGWRDARTALVLTTYDTLRDYALSFAQLPWSIVVCDEAQKIKNPNAMVSRAVKALRADFCVAATGTPVENNLTDLWSIYDFIQPGLLEALNEFTSRYRRPIEAEGRRDRQRLAELWETIRPQLMRRVKEDVLDALPRKHVDRGCLELPMSSVQRTLYARAISEYRANSPADRRGAMLTLLHRLRAICVDPRVGDDLAAELVPPLDQHRRDSPKLDWLIRTLETIRARGEKVIVFTERRDLQRLLKHYIDQWFGLSVSIVNGDTLGHGAGGRQDLIDEFQAVEGFNVIIMSQRAAGVGLNVQRANHVIHYTREWNPAKEDQATDRAYRIGQERDVIVYTPTVTLAGVASFEQRLGELLERKRRLARDVLNGCDDVTAQEMAEGIEADLERLDAAVR